MRTNLIEKFCLRFPRLAIQLHIGHVKNETQKTKYQEFFEQFDSSKLPNLDHIDFAALVNEEREHRTDRILESVQLEKNSDEGC